MKSDNVRYRVLTPDHRIKYTGTDNPSWFTLDKAKELKQGDEMIYEYCLKTMNPLWEVF
jgi:hypothetical protein